MKSTLIFLLLTSLFAAYSNAQNLVPNPDFESRTSNFCGIFTEGDFDNTLADWYTPTDGSADAYFTDIATGCWNFQPNSTYSGPIGIKGSQLPRSGSSMAGIFTYTIPGNNSREYLQVELITPTVPGGKYLVECYVSLADSTELAANNFGIHVGVSPVWMFGDGVIPVTPQVNEVNIIQETQNWVRVFDTITVTGAFDLLTIGNFSLDGNTSTVANPTGSGAVGAYGAYYYVDDVRVERVFAEGTSSLEEMNNLMVSVYPNPTTDFVKIEFDEDQSIELMEFTDVDGNILWSEHDVWGEQLIDLNEFAKGTYFLRIITSSKIHIEKIVKQ